MTETYRQFNAGNAVISELDRPPLPVAWAVPTSLLPEHWWIYPGPFKDRMGMDALAVAASTHDACKAVVSLLEGRLYVDLKGGQVASMLNLLIATSQPTVNAMFAGSGPMTATKRDAILAGPTTEAERYVKGLVQPT